MSRILIIDDDLHMRMACSRALAKVGHTIVCEASGDEGLREIRNAPESFDVVLLDQLMPGMSGMEALEQIKSFAPDLPVIIITGSATEEATRDLIAKGAFDCLPKPFTPEQLRTAVAKTRS